MLSVATFGGNANNGTNAGTWYWNLNYDSGNANQNIGNERKAKSITSYHGWFKHSDSWKLWDKYISDFKSIKNNCK